MTYIGHMRDGVAVFDGPAPPDGTVVPVWVLTNEAEPQGTEPKADTPSIYDRGGPVSYSTTHWET